MAGFQEIPIIDVGPLFDKNLKHRKEVGRQLHKACKDVGFFYVTNHGIDHGRMKQVLEAAERWFALPVQHKREIELTPDSRYRGYQPLGSNVTRYDSGFSRDWHEGIDFYKEGLAGSEEESPVHGSNLWPSQDPEFEKLLRSHLEACLHVGQTLMRGIALGLGIAEDYFETPQGGHTTAETSYWVARVIHYPPLSEADSYRQELADDAAKGKETERSVQLSCGEHSDYGLLTLVNQQEGVTALQAKNQAGQWISAASIPGTLVCNIGDMLKVYTNGLYTPTPHRVINADPTRCRVSLPFFYESAFEAEVAPIPSLVHPDSQPLHHPIKYGRHLLSKVLSNFELHPNEAAAAI